MAAPTYASVDEFASRLGLGDLREGELQHALDAASRWIDKQTRRRFYAVTETRYYSARWHYPRMGIGMGGYGDYPWGYPERPQGGGISGQHIAIDDFVAIPAALVGGAITAITNVTNPVVATATAHGLVVGQQVAIAGVLGATAANGTWMITSVPDTTHYQITAPVPGVWTSGGTTTAVATPIVASDDDGSGAYATIWTVGRDYWLGPRNAAVDGLPYRSINRNQVTSLYVFPPWENGISVTGASGFSTAVPESIRQLCVMVAEMLARPVLEMSIPGVSSYKLGNDLAVTMRAEDLPPLGQAILDQYRDPLFVM